MRHLGKQLARLIRPLDIGSMPVGHVAILLPKSNVVIIRRDVWDARDNHVVAVLMNLESDWLYA
jgi:hypothetical protein